jgi:hypothetical protein
MPDNEELKNDIIELIKTFDTFLDNMDDRNALSLDKDKPVLDYVDQMIAKYNIEK